jgi:hypothetical protein
MMSVLLLWVAAAQATATPGETWTEKPPAEVGMDAAKLDAFRAAVGGRGFVSRHGYQVYAWGDYTTRGDIASAAKPFYSHFLFKAVEERKLPNVDVKAALYEPRLNDINAALGFKDRSITFRHLANQTSGYGVRENPGSAFCYNDWQMALFWDTLFLKVYGATYANVDVTVLGPKLTGPLQCQDAPTFLAFGAGDRPGRVAISPRDHARFGLLYLRQGNWNGRQLLDPANVRMAVSSPLPNSIPRTAGQAAEMIAGQRSIGSKIIPDNQTDHLGSYSWLWWTNGVDRSGKRLFPDVPTDCFVASGHGGKRLLAVIPSLDLVCAWNDAKMEGFGTVHDALRLLVQSVTNAGPLPGQIVPDAHKRWLKVHGGGPFFMVGAGDPEGFLYRGTRLADGTRSGDQKALIQKMKGTGANALYLIAVRSHGGDGGPTENPFINSDPAQGLDEDILQQWETWFAEMDAAGIVIFFIFYDDGARIWPGDTVGGAERVFLRTIVNRFEHHKNLIWCVAEEYAETYSAARVRNIAAEIRAADDHDHVIAVHKNVGTSFAEFADDPNIDLFAMQLAENATAPQLHADVVAAWKSAAGKYALLMAESVGYGRGSTARRKDWACALAGAYVLRYGMDVASSTTEELGDCGRLAGFMRSTNFSSMAPRDELRFGGTEYVLALPGDSYIAYASALSGNVGLRNMTAGMYDFRWFDCANGTTVLQTGVSVASGDQTWVKPSGLGNELAVHIRRRDGGTLSVTIDFVSTGRPYGVSTAQPGALYYIDRSYRIDSLSGALSGARMVRTANDDKSVTSGTHLRFTVSQPATVYVAYDRRAVRNPPWLEDGTWAATGETFAVSDAGASPMRVYRKSVGPGTVTLGGNHAGGDTGARSNYVVLIRGGTSSAKLAADDAWEHPGDADGDGLEDEFESRHFLDPANPDTDGDGEPDEAEVSPSGRTYWEEQEAVAGEDADGPRCGLLGGEILLLAAAARWGRRRLHR